MSIKIVRARSSDEYVQMIEQAPDDVWDLHQSDGIWRMRVSTSGRLRTA